MAETCAPGGVCPDDAFAPLAKRLWARHAEKNLWGGVRERTAETLAELRRRGLRLGVISNADGRVDALLEMGSAGRLAAGVQELRHAGADAVVWACTR